MYVFRDDTYARVHFRRCRVKGKQKIVCCFFTTREARVITE